MGMRRRGTLQSTPRRFILERPFQVSLECCLHPSADMQEGPWWEQETKCRSPWDFTGSSAFKAISNCLLKKQSRCISHFLKTSRNTLPTPNTPNWEVLPSRGILNMARALPGRLLLHFTRPPPRSAKPSWETKLNQSNLLKPREHGVAPRQASLMTD